jgi:hypothetical protein
MTKVNATTALTQLRLRQGRGQIRADFLANAQAIVQGLDAGQSIKCIWTNLAASGEFRGSYAQFAAYAKRLLVRKVALKP